MSKHEEVSPVSLPRLAMTASPTTVLLVEDDCIDAGLILKALADPEDGSFHVEWVTCLADARDRLARGGIDVILLDLTLPDGEGIEAFDQVLQAAPDALILVLSAADDEEAARRAARRARLSRQGPCRRLLAAACPSLRQRAQGDRAGVAPGRREIV
jgi:CheY-like chemotaxis protein